MFHRPGHRVAGVVVVGLLSAARALAQAPTPAVASPSPAAPCSAPEHRQFDFWLGDWDVRDPQGRIVGTNLITREYGGCVLQEHWDGGTTTGGSFNIYSAAAGRWHQSWVDTNGTLLLLDGEFRDGKMQLAGEGKRSGTKVLHRISWQPRADGKVRQLWETSSDGSSWSVAFDGLYERKKSR